MPTFTLFTTLELSLLSVQFILYLKEVSAPNTVAAVPRAAAIGKVNAPGKQQHLKVPKREIFDRSDFPDFYIIKSLCGGDFGVKIKKIFINN